jgi:hypothetical protein
MTRHISETAAVNLIARELGERDDWDSPADILEAIADIVGRTGRPHPGNDPEPETYLARLRDWNDVVQPWHDGPGQTV